jgi:hypothetical protein
MTLSESELLAFCGLVRMLVRLDGQVSPEERQAVEEIGPALARRDVDPKEPYRETAKDEDDGVERFWATMDLAAGAMTTEQDVRDAAVGVTRQEAREQIHAALYALAASDVISEPEWSMLTWLASKWGIPA